MRSYFCKAGMMMAILIVSHVLYAKDLGVVGQVYPIQEEDFLEFILHRISSMQQTGVWARLQDQWRQRVKEEVIRPHPVNGLTPAMKTKSWNDDPSVEVSHTLYDSKGDIVVLAGTHVNPLKFVTIHRPLVFFNNDDKKQVSWVDHLSQKLAGKIKLVLINGSLIDGVDHFHQPIFFDQGGKLTSRFGIQHVPAIVRQEGTHLKITEVAI